MTYTREQYDTDLSKLIETGLIQTGMQDADPKWAQLTLQAIGMRAQSRMNQTHLGTDGAGPVCLFCGCTDEDCTGCINRTRGGEPCRWVWADICSACWLVLPGFMRDHLSKVRQQGAVDALEAVDA